MKTSDFVAIPVSRQSLVGLRVMDGCGRLQPTPKGPLPVPESYDKESCGPNPDRPGLMAIGRVIEPVPVTGLAANFSPIPRIAPPPLGSEICGAVNGEASALPFLSLSPVVPFSAMACPS